MIPILMISQGWFCPVFEASPGRLITILEIFGAASFVGQVACRKNRARNLLDQLGCRPGAFRILATGDIDRKSTRLNSSHSQISYAVFCLKKKTDMETALPLR